MAMTQNWTPNSLGIFLICGAKPSAALICKTTMPAAIQSVPFRRVFWILSLYSTVMGRPKVKLKSEKRTGYFIVKYYWSELGWPLLAPCVHHLALKLLNWNKEVEGRERAGFIRASWVFFLLGIFHLCDESWWKKDRGGIRMTSCAWLDLP